MKQKREPAAPRQICGDVQASAGPQGPTCAKTGDIDETRPAIAMNETIKARISQFYSKKYESPTAYTAYGWNVRTSGVTALHWLFRQIVPVRASRPHIP